MAKCGECNSRKGKRSCAAGKIQICSQCCGTVRNPIRCSECSYYSPPKKRYQDIPSFSTTEMDHDEDLQSISNTIEAVLCRYDFDTKERISDTVPITIIERLLDKYHFGDSALTFDNIDIEKGFAAVDEAITRDLSEIDQNMLVKVLSVIRFVARRRTTGKREYLTILKQYVGVSIGHGARIVDFEQ
jgi:hypothetical protein